MGTNTENGIQIFGRAIRINSNIRFGRVFDSSTKRICETLLSYNFLCGVDLTTGKFLSQLCIQKFTFNHSM